MLFKKLPEIFWNLTMAASCLFFHDLMKPPLASEIQVKFSVAILSLPTSCAKQQGAQGSLHLFLFNDIQRFPSTETSKHSERSLKTLALFFLRSRVAKSPTWQGSAPSQSEPPATSPCSPHSQPWIRALTFVCRARGDYIVIIISL